MQGVDAHGARVGGGASAVWRLVDVFSVYVDGIGNKSRAAVAAAGVALLESKELKLGLDAVNETLAHGCGWGCRRSIVEELVCGSWVRLVGQGRLLFWMRLLVAD